MKQGHGWKRAALAGFFLLMLVCTFLSRIYDSLSVPRVQTAYPRRKSVETVITGTGTVRENETACHRVYPGLRVESVAVSAGSEVKAGDELFRYQMDSVLEKKADLELELQKAKLNEERLAVSSETYARVGQAELAERQLQLARQELAEGQQEYQEKWSQHLANLENLKQDFERTKQLSADELLLQQEQQMNSAGAELRSARESRDEELAAAWQEIEDLEAELAAADGQVPDRDEEQAEPETEAGAEGTPDRTELEKQLARAREDLNELERQWENRISGMEDSYDILEYQSERIRRGQTSSQQARQESYDEAVRQEESSWQEEERKLKELEQKEADARWELDVAVRQDEYTRLTADQQKRLAEIDRRLQELTVTQIQREIGQLDEIIAAGGKAEADMDGTVILQEVTAGRTSTGEERLSIAFGSRIFEAGFDKEGQELAEGDLLNITIPGGGRTVEARIDHLNLLAEETGTFQADLDQLALPIGTETSYECRKTSDIYQKVIPLTALRKDMSGYYCLAVRAERAVLGEEFRAERVDLTVLRTGDNEAAVDGAIMESDRLITTADQVIAAGDRVRPVDVIEE